MSEELQAAMQLHASPLPPVRQQSPEPPQHGQGEGPEAIRPPSGGRSRLVPVPGGGVPGGGTQLPTGDQPGDPWATLVVVLADGLMGERPPPRAASSQPCIPAGRERLPPPVAAGIASAVELSGAVARSLVVCGGGGGASGGLIAAAMMSEVARVTPGGIDAFGPGRRIEALLKETSAEFGNLWEAALYSKALAKRQRARVRFGEVAVITSPQLAPHTVRVFEYVFTDWRVLVSGGQCRGGRDLPLPVRAIPVDVSADAANEAALVARAERLAESDAEEDWWARGLRRYRLHPAWPASGAATESERE
mmetsp:Transcript_6902/g.22163  ORF Transcript_6902/g.22163 Transcript_6902/m.22163 type:complete len:307 (-) Transcript_6902:225-1145(-)